MQRKKKPIRLRPDEDQLIRKLYVQWRIPRGQYKKHPDYLHEFTSVWNGFSGRNDTPVDVLHYMDTQQKIKKRLAVPWPVFEGAHRRLEPVANILTSDHMKLLKELYREIVIPENVGTEGLIYHEMIIERLASAFRDATGMSVPGMMLAAKIEEERKAGTWLRLKDGAFSDLDKIG